MPAAARWRRRCRGQLSRWRPCGRDEARSGGASLALRGAGVVGKEDLLKTRLSAFEIDDPLGRDRREQWRDVTTQQSADALALHVELFETRHRGEPRERRRSRELDLDPPRADADELRERADGA